jgi:hypothetical protein
MGETCGMRLVNQNYQDLTICKLCQKLATKSRRREAEAKRYETWRQEGRLGQFTASAEKCLEMVHDLDREIQMLQAERMQRYHYNLRARTEDTDFSNGQTNKPSAIDHKPLGKPLSAVQQNAIKEEFFDKVGDFKSNK